MDKNCFCGFHSLSTKSNYIFETFSLTYFSIMHILVETSFISFSFYSLSNITPANKITDKFVYGAIGITFHLPRDNLPRHCFV